MIENRATALQALIGVDEVGRGAWAGPLVVGAVQLAEIIPGLTDSKLVSKKQRKRLAEEIKLKAAWYGLGWVEPDEIDLLGLSAATTLAIRRAIEDGPVADIIIDGKINYLSDNLRARCEVKGDLNHPCVSAASILAKVERDKYMVEQAKSFPGYGFERNVGYGTAGQITALKNLGITPLHRKSYRPIRELAGA